MDLHPHLRVLVLHRAPQRAHLHLDPQFLPQLPLQAGFEGFVGFTFASGKLPEPAEVCPGRAAGDEEAALVEDQPGGDLDVSRA